MATPVTLTDANESFIPRVGQPFDVHVRDYQLGQQQTIEFISVWAFDEAERAEVEQTGLVFLRLLEYQPPVCVFHALITEFEGQNAIFRLGDCNDLPAFVREVTIKGEQLDEITSAWRLNETGLQIFRESGFVYLSIVGNMADVQIFGTSPVVHIEKGEKYGECNRKACSLTNAIWFNHSTEKYYCELCAQQINYYNRADAMRLFGHDLCIRR